MEDVGEPGAPDPEIMILPDNVVLPNKVLLPT